MASDPISRLQELSAIENTSLEGVLAKAVFLPIVTFFVAAADAIDALLNVFIAPVDAFAAAIGGLIDGIIGGAGDVIGAGALASADAFTSGLWAELGPAAFPVAIASALAGAYLLAQYLELESTSDLIPFSFTDFPFIGADEEAD